jgi:hypothetical protein
MEGIWKNWLVEEGLGELCFGGLLSISIYSLSFSFIVSRNGRFLGVRESRSTDACVLCFDNRRRAVDILYEVGLWSRFE